MKIKKSYIKLLIRKRSLKQKDVAERINVSVQDWNNWMFRSVFPHFDKLEALAEILEVHVDELINHEEAHEGGDTSYLKQGSYIPNSNQIPYFAGDNLLNNKLFEEFDSEFPASDYISLPGINGHLSISVFGKDMQPIISSGDLIILRKMKDLSFFNYGSIYMIRTAHQSIIRYIRKGSRSNLIMLVAENSDFDTFEIPISKITSAFLVLSVIKQNSI